MAAPSGRAAGLAYFSEQLPNIFSNVLNTYRSGMDRKEDEKTRAMQRESMGLDIEAKKQALSSNLSDIEQKRQAAAKIDEVMSALQNEETRAGLLKQLEKARTELSSGKIPTAVELPQSGQVPQSQFAGMDKNEFVSQKLTPYRGVDVRAESMAGAAEKGIQTERQAESDMINREQELSDKSLQHERLKELYGIKTEGQKELIETKASYAPSPTDKQPTSAQFAAASYAKRIEQSEDAISKLTSQGFNPSSIMNRVIEKGDISAIKDPQQRQYAQAMRTFVNSTLRRESGAAIAESEFKSAIKQYFPQVGDDPETIEQKRQARLAVQSALRAEAGNAYTRVNEQLQSISSPKQTNTPSTDFRSKYGY